MLTIAQATTDFQRLAARQRPWPAALALAAAGAGVPALLLHFTLAALHNGHAGCAGVLLAVALAAAVLAGLATRASLAKLGWLGLIKHCLILARRDAAGRASARVRALARGLYYMFCIFERRLKLILAAATVIIGNRLLPTACITPRIKSQRPN